MLKAMINAAKVALTPTSKFAEQNLRLLSIAVINPTKKAELDTVAKRILEGKDRYKAVAAIMGNGIPWWFVGITHFMEAGVFYPNQFKYHLHCGDPLTARTVHVPKGRPVADPAAGKGKPYTWEESALDALRYMKYDRVTDWSPGNAMWLFEEFNGLGYRKYHNMLSPYVWSYTNQYSRGKYASDGKFDPTLVSKQPGTAAIYLHMVQNNLI